jgi:hypothetical protein
MDVIKKIPIKDLIEILMDLYEKGVDYADIAGDSQPSINKLIITVEPEYMSDNDEDFIDEDEDFEIDEDKDEDFNKKLSEKDLNDLV